MSFQSNTVYMKQDVKNAILTFLYEPVSKGFHQEIVEVVRANIVKTKSSQIGFMYRGEWFTTDYRKLYPRRKQRLHKDLVSQMDGILERRKAVYDVEVPYVNGYITKVLNTSDSVEDFIALFPQALSKPIKESTVAITRKPAKHSDEFVQAFLQENAKSLEYLKTRLVLNLLE